MNYHFARLKDQDRLTPYQVSMAKNSVPRRSKSPVWRVPSRRQWHFAQFQSSATC